MAKIAPVVAPPARKGPSPAVTGLKKGLEKANQLTKRTNAKLRELRAGGRFGRAAVDTGEAAFGGMIGGAMDGMGIAIPVGEPRYYAWVEVSASEPDPKTGKRTAVGFVDSSDGDDKNVSLGEATKGLQVDQWTIPVAAPLGLVTVAAGAYMEQADLVELGKGAVGYGFGRMSADAARMVKRTMFGEDAA